MKTIYLAIGLLAAGILGAWIIKKINLNSNHEIGEPIDSLNNVIVYYNGGVDNVLERNLSSDGYNLGLKYQCVEFVKRYYYEHLNHRMPDSYGHAKDFFNKDLPDGEVNLKRGLIQFTNPSETQPETGDIVVFSGTLFNRFGHVAIVSNIKENEIEIIQQNPGPFGQPREVYSLNQINGKWRVENSRVLGWLRKP